MDHDRKNRFLRQKTLRQALIPSLFALYTSTSRAQLMHAVKRKQIDPQLSDFSRKLMILKTAIKELQQVLSEKQVPHCCKAFFYGINFLEEDGKQLLQLELSKTQTHVKDVSATIPTYDEWKLLDGYIADLLQEGENDNDEVKQQIVQECDVFSSAISTQADHFAKEQEETKKRVKRREEKEASKQLEKDLKVLAGQLTEPVVASTEKYSSKEVGHHREKSKNKKESKKRIKRSKNKNRESDERGHQLKEEEKKNAVAAEEEKQVKQRMTVGKKCPRTNIVQTGFGGVAKKLEPEPLPQLLSSDSSSDGESGMSSDDEEEEDKGDTVSLDITPEDLLIQYTESVLETGSLPETFANSADFMTYYDTRMTAKDQAELKARVIDALVDRRKQKDILDKHRQIANEVRDKAAKVYPRISPLIVQQRLPLMHSK